MLTGFPWLYSSEWVAFAERHTRADITHGIRKLFGEYWPHPEPPNKSTAFGLFNHNSFSNNITVLCDSRLEVISPPGLLMGGSHRGPHLDTANRLFSALLYFRHDNDNSTGGGLDLFTWKNISTRPKHLDIFQFPQDLVQLHTSIPFRSNTLVAFPNHPDAIHGAAFRGPTNFDRAYVFITAEVEHNLFPVHLLSNQDNEEQHNKVCASSSFPPLYSENSSAAVVV
mmetsp:Transcript_2275/g.3612  ORF Transcript_2275/g.3612 Transcript_2275/m.3612 type:complete len:226 (-) Transcript_2275:110-787(-)